MSGKPSSSRITANAAGREFWFREGCYIAEWWNQADDPDVSIAHARLPAGTSTRWHRLLGITERYLIQSGQGRVELGDRPAASVAPGDGVVIAPGVAQRIINTGQRSLCFLAICTPRFQPQAYRDDED